MTPDQNPPDRGLNQFDDAGIDIKGTGLRGIEVADTHICMIDGKEGTLLYRGYNINDLTRNSSYEEVVHLLVFGNLPAATQLEEFSRKLALNRDLPQEIIVQLQTIPKTADSMSVLQSTVASLAYFDPELDDDSKDANFRKAARIIAKIPTVVASWERIRNDQKLIAPDKTLPYAANFLYMLRGKKPTNDMTQCMDVALILHAEHSFNASTFTARVIASTGADIYTAISGAIGSLSGKLHGGANSRVMRNLQEIGEITNVETWVKEQFDSGKRIMGMGHAVYKTMDPRAKIISEMAERFIQDNAEDIGKWFNITNKMVEVTQEQFMTRKNRQIYPNVDLYSPSVYSAMGIPMEVYTPIFAISRTGGWIAHVIEEKFPEAPETKPALYRPSADYVGLYCGPLGCEFTPLIERDKEFLDAGLVKQLVIQELQKVQSKNESDYQQIVSLVTQKIRSESESQPVGTSTTRDLITEKDVQDLSQTGKNELCVTAGTIITPLAKDRAKELGISIKIR